ncbi:hypothetical protein [Kitasatospora sp. NPDC097691]|uniref:hypothetical protein n=1 Tax=Kitasatospora sp. NPDC097691 TaxID=3157231 RepID=UPI0033201DC2
MPNGLDLWSQNNQLGGNFSVETPDGHGRVTLESPFKAYGATNLSAYDAELYAGQDQSGEPLETVGRGQTALFPRGQNIGSVNFVQD